MEMDGVKNPGLTQATAASMTTVDQTTTSVSNVEVVPQETGTTLHWDMTINMARDGV